MTPLEGLHIPSHKGRERVPKPCPTWQLLRELIGWVPDPGSKMKLGDVKLYRRVLPMRKDLATREECFIFR